MSQPVISRAKSPESSTHKLLAVHSRAKSQDIESVQRSLIESAQKPVAMHFRSFEPEDNTQRRESPAVKMLSPRLDSGTSARSPPRFERPHSPSSQSKPNIMRLGSHRRVVSDDSSVLTSSKPDFGRRASLGESFKASPLPSPGMTRRSSLNDSLLRRQYSSGPRPDITRPLSVGNDLIVQSRRGFASHNDITKPPMIKSQSADGATKREYQVRVVKGPQLHDSSLQAPEDPSDGEALDPSKERSVSPNDDSKKASRVVVSIPETLITKIQQALKEAGEEGLSCAQLMNTPSCKRLRFPCTLQGATPGSILRELPCVRHDSKRYYYVEPGTAVPAAMEFTHRRQQSKAENIENFSLSVKLQYSTADLLAMRNQAREESEFDILVKEKLFLLGLLPRASDEEDDSSYRSRTDRDDSTHRSRTDDSSYRSRTDDSSYRSVSRMSSAPILPLTSPPALTRKESVRKESNLDGSVQSQPSAELQTPPDSSEVQEFARMLQFYKTHNFCIDSAARVNESAAALLTLLSQCGDIPQSLYGPGVFPLVRRIYEKTKETPFWSECRASVHQVITTALQLPQNSSSQQSWLMRFLLGCEASTEERASSQPSSSIWNSLTQEIMAEIAILNPGESLRNRQQGAIERMGVLGKTIKLGLQVFGPVAFGLASILSHVHLQTVGGPKTDAVKLLLSLLQESSHYTNVQMVRPGMIQCFDIDSALSVTVCCHSRQEYKVASEMTALVLAYRSLDSRFELLFHMVSKWAQMGNLVDEVEGLSLWGWILLVIHYLQTIPSRILPVLDCFVPSTPSPFKTRRDSSPSIAASSILALAAQNAPNSETANPGWSSTNTDCIGELLVGFFARYAVEFNPDQQCVSVRMGSFLDAAEYRATLRALDPSFAPTPHPHISVASPADVVQAYSAQVSKGTAPAPASALSASDTDLVSSSKSPIGLGSPKGTHADLKSIEADQAEVETGQADVDSKNSVPFTEVPSLPTTEIPKTSLPSTEIPSLPSTEIPSLPSTERPSLPTTEIPFLPTTEVLKNSLPATEMPSSPTTEILSATEIPDSKSDATTTQVPPETPIKSLQHRKSTSLSTISELGVNKSNSSTPLGGARSLPNNSTPAARPKNCEHALCVEDPFRPTENVAMNTSRTALRRIQIALDIARTTLLSHAPLRQIFVIGNVQEKLPQLTEA